MAMAVSKPPKPGPNLTAEVQSLAKDVAHDALAAARIGLRLAERAGRKGVALVERTAARVLKDLK